ncbi:MAG TPA: ribosomal protein S18-alanine N-acetyltransferase [Sphingomicrobium sp.]|nr:ribosomal protein S18-alanine N-acetyltransferase [Sphingomicrobium sp.]
MIGKELRPVPPIPIVVYSASADDLDSVMGIMAAAFSPFHGEAWTRSQCAGILPMSGVSLRLARSTDSNAVGFSLMRVVADEAELLLIAVAPTAQREGVGRALIDDFITLASARGARQLHLEVREGNGALTLYERAGFAIVGRRRDYYRGKEGAPLDALTLALKLGRD